MTVSVMPGPRVRVRAVIANRPGGLTMFTPDTARRMRVAATVTAMLICAPFAAADDMVSFATGGYASGLRTGDMMKKIDANKDGMVSKDEWVAYQEKVFVMLDKDKTMVVDEKEFLTPSGEMASFATGGYARGLQSKEMMSKIDKNKDGKVSHDEYIEYQVAVFEMMDPGHGGSVGPNEFLGKGR
jgi:Ca2+-binding EF-hand superfamily protein